MKVIKSEIKYLIERYYQVQEHRIALQGQVRALKEENEPTALLEDYKERFHKIEKSLHKDIQKAVKEHPMWDWLEEVKGIGPILGAALVITIDIEKAQHASSVWKYAGLAPGQKRKKGQKLDYNPFLKTICWKVGESFVKVGDKYRERYDSSKEYYQKKFPKEKEVDGVKKYTKGHIHNMARRRAVKLFLSHFWAEWRERAGLPVSKPYAHRHETD